MKFNNLKTHIHFPVNHCGRDFVVSDIHGCFKVLEEKLTALEFNPLVDRLFVGGDNIDRHPDSVLALEWLSKPWFHSIRGNHEQLIINAYRGSESDLWLSVQNGGQWFNCLFEKDKLEYIEAFESLPYAFSVDTKEGKVGIIHAEVVGHDWDVTLSMLASNDETTKQHVTWARNKIRVPKFRDRLVKGIDKLYVGHTVVDAITQCGNVTYIDTGCVFTGNLTILQIN